MEKNCKRPYKGNSLIEFPDDYIVLDLETTGLSPVYNEIIEVGAIKIRDGKIADQFNAFCKPENPIPYFITDLTGITNEMVKDAPSIKTVLKQVEDFVGEEIIVGHNVNFDINFIYEKNVEHFGKPFTNNFIDTMRISRKLYPELPHHRLSDLTKHLHIKQEGAHRAVDDCISTFKCFEIMKSSFIMK